MNHAYCLQSAAASTARAAGVEPVTCPPVDYTTYDCRQWQGAQFVYLKLHGLADEPYLYGDGWQTALSAGQLSGLQLRGVVLFVASCYLVESPLLEAFRATRPALLIGGAGENWQAASGVTGVDLLALFVRTALQWGLSPHWAFRFGKTRLQLKRRKNAAIADALQFRAWEV